MTWRVRPRGTISVAALVIAAFSSGPLLAQANDRGEMSMEPTAAPTPDDLPKARLEYALGPGAQECPSAEMMRSAVAARLGFMPFTDIADRTLRVRLFSPAQATDGAPHPHAHKVVLVAEVLLLEGDERVGERRLESETADCTELSRALELAMAVAVDPLSLTRPPPPKPPPPPPECPPLPPVPLCEEPPPKEVEEEPTSEVVIEQTKSVPEVVLFDFGGTPPGEYPKIFASVGAMGLLDTTGDQPTAGFVLNVGLRVHPHVSIAYEGRAETPSETVGAGGVVKTQLTTGSLVPCFHQGWLTGCALLTAGATAGSYEPFLPSGEFGFLLAPYVAVGGRAALEIPIWRFFLRIHLDVNGQVLVLQAVDTVTNVEYYRQDYLSGGAGIAFGGSFP